MTVVNCSDLEFVPLPGRHAADPLGHLETQSSLRIVTLERVAGRTAHRHPHSEEIFYVESGQGEVWIDGTTHPVTTGDVVHIPAGAAHATVPVEGSTMRLVCFFPHPHLGENSEDTGIQVS